jgi:PAS domain S-box-containing protein
MSDDDREFASPTCYASDPGLGANGYVIFAPPSPTAKGPIMRTDRLGEILLRDLPEALVGSDADGIIRVWNAAAERLFGFAAAEAVGQSLDLIIPERLRERHWAGYRETMRTGQSRYAAGELLSVPALCKDGSRKSVQFSILPLPAPGGPGLEGMLAVMRDATADFEERKRLQAELKALRSA